jgi:ribosome-associated heat shock protein Hsp15
MSTEDDRTRVDKWLWAARFFKTRSLAADAIDGSKVFVNGVKVKPARALKVGDELLVRTQSAEFVVLVQQLSSRRGSALDAAKLFTETEDSRRRREEAKLSRVDPHPDAYSKGRPTKRARRMIHKLRGEPL